MLKLLAIIFLFQTLLAEEQSDAEVVSKGMKYVGECAMENKINYATCLKMYEKVDNHDDPKYKGCKCTIPCVAKKMNMMTPEGKFKEDEILKVINDLKTPGFKEEGLKVYALCKNVEGANCDAGYEMVKCAVKNSKTAQNLISILLKLKKGKV